MHNWKEDRNLPEGRHTRQFTSSYQLSHSTLANSMDRTQGAKEILCQLLWRPDVVDTP